MPQQIASIPMRTIGPIRLIGDVMNEEVTVPLATFETPVWPSTNRGAKVTREAGGMRVTIVDECMSRSVAVEAEHAGQLQQIKQELLSRKAELDAVVASTSRFAQLLAMHFQVIGKLMFIRFEFLTGDASGHNMVTKASERLLAFILEQYSQLKYVSLSGNYCTDKKTSAVNGILGRGKNVVTEMTIPRAVCEQVLKTTPEKLVEINIKKNLIGTAVAGGLRSANAHFANVLLAFYLATGQDAANIVEGSQGFVTAEMAGDDLYFSATLPNVIVGTVGNGKGLDFVTENLALMDCLAERATGENSRRLAAICAAATACCELSLLAALTNPGELMRAHEVFERKTAEVK
jgi:hydroxymethylglutaryl-CoA reductase (NADPH)